MIPYRVVLICNFIFGVGFGYVLWSMIHGVIGKLKIDTSDPEVDRYLMEFDVPLEQIHKKKKVVLKVDLGAEVPGIEERRKNNKPYNGERG